MQITSIDRNIASKLFGAAVALVLLVFLVTGKQSDPVVLITAVALAVVSIYPLFLWVLGSSAGLPIWPAFALVNGLQSALPMVQNPLPVQTYSAEEIVTGGITLALFILLGTAVWVFLSGKRLEPPRSVLMIRQDNVVPFLLFFLLARIAFELNRFWGWTEPLGDLAQVLRAVTGSLSTLALFVLAYLSGRKMLSAAAKVLFWVFFLLILVMSSSGLLLIASLIPLGMVALGYTFGAGRFPWKFVTAAFVVLAILHPGKAKMRELYWSPESPRLTVAQLPGFYMEWIGYGLEEAGGLGGIFGTRTEEEEVSTIFDRSGSLHMLLLVQQKSPEDVPFLGGLTFEPIPYLLVPRLLDKGKGISHIGNVILSISYGIQTIETVQTTSIQWGLVPEAFANFGYPGVALLAVFLGSFYAFAARLTVGVPLTSLRFVLGLLFLGAAIQADTMGVFVSSQFQGVVAVAMISILLMKRQRNPFASGGVEEREQRAPVGWREIYGRRREGFGLRPANVGAPLDDGMPAPGLLAALIEGEASQAVVADAPVDGEAAGPPRHVRSSGPLPKKAAAWMPRWMREQIAAQGAERKG